MYHMYMVQYRVETCHEFTVSNIAYSTIQTPALVSNLNVASIILCSRVETKAMPTRFHSRVICRDKRFQEGIENLALPANILLSNLNVASISPCSRVQNKVMPTRFLSRVICHDKHFQERIENMDMPATIFWRYYLDNFSSRGMQFLRASAHAHTCVL